MQLMQTVMNFVISNANAAPPNVPGSPQGGGMQIALMVGFFIIFMYFAMWRPQSKRAKEQRELINSLSKGDEVITAGGILGKIAKVTDNYVVLNLTESVEIVVQKSAIASVLPKGTLKAI